MFYLCHKCIELLLNHKTISYKSYLRQLSVVFYGSDDFSLHCLQRLHKDFTQSNDTNVIKRLDLVLSSKSNIISRFGRQNQLTSYAFPYDLPQSVYDIGIVSSFGHLIPNSAISACRLGMLNIHGSLLPRWRGAAPVNYAVLNNDSITGITVMRIKPKKFDIGDIVMQCPHEIRPRITAKELKEELAPIGSQLLWKCLTDLENSLSQSKPQPKDGITYAPKFDETYGRIDWSSMTATDVDLRFRAFVGFIDIYTEWTDGTRLKFNDIVDPQLVATLDLNRLSKRSEAKPGFVYYHKKRRLLCVGCKDNTWSAFTSLSLKGHQRVSALQFYNGFISKHKSDVILGLNL